ncbi:MAG: class I SAM-dependent methyltransferase [Bacteroidales bacterium]|jgi:SAM-dependent methyltransferase|nr:class I SAM-dependent methyltransferase [Bacteroidales bacterium]
MREFIKYIVKKLFGWFGLDVVSKNRMIMPPVDTLQHNTEEGIDRYWSDTASKDLWDAPATHEFYRKVITILKENKIDLNGKSVADLGCGNGNLLLYLSRHYSAKEYYGYEYSKEALKLAADIFPQAKYSYHNLLNAINHEFDFIFCTEVLEHILHPDVAFTNIINTIAPSGGAIITVPEGRKDTSTRHINFWSPESWQVFCDTHLPIGLTCRHQLIDNLQCTIYKRESLKEHSVIS